MRFIVAPLITDTRTLRQQEQIDGSINFPTSKQYAKKFWRDVTQAEAEARRLATENPGVNYAVYAPVSVVEAQKAAVTLVSKEINGSGELIVRPSA